MVALGFFCFGKATATCAGRLLSFDRLMGLLKGEGNSGHNLFSSKMVAHQNGLHYCQHCFNITTRSQCQMANEKAQYKVTEYTIERVFNLDSTLWHTSPPCVLALAY